MHIRKCLIHHSIQEEVPVYSHQFFEYFFSLFAYPSPVILHPTLTFHSLKAQKCHFQLAVSLNVPELPHQFLAHIETFFSRYLFSTQRVALTSAVLRQMF